MPWRRLLQSTEGDGKSRQEGKESGRDGDGRAKGNAANSKGAARDCRIGRQIEPPTDESCAATEADASEASGPQAKASEASRESGERAEALGGALAFHCAELPRCSQPAAPGLELHLVPTVAFADTLLLVLSRKSVQRGKRRERESVFLMSQPLSLSLSLFLSLFRRCRYLIRGGMLMRIESALRLTSLG